MDSRPLIPTSSAAAIKRLKPRAILDSIDRTGYALSAPIVGDEECRALAALYEAEAAKFRSTVTMARHGFGRGEYKYFAYPLPPLVAELRRHLYEVLAPVANEWSTRLGGLADWPARHEALLERCSAAGQPRPTPLLLRYGVGDFNCLHQDLYGAIHFPLQAILLLDQPAVDFDGGELVLVEQRPRRQSTPIVVPLVRGAIAIVPVKERPAEGPRGFARVGVRHGVSSLRRGSRRTLGLIFHDAA